MSNTNQILQNIAGRLGLSEEIVVIQKSDEFLRILHSKTAVKKLGDYAKVVLCLDLSCHFLGIGFDKESAFLLSGLKKSVYQNNFNMLEKVLDLDKPLTVAEVCVQLSCTIIQDLATNILKMYSQNYTLDDISHPQYVVVAIFTACKLKSIKVKKSQFIALSRLKPMQWKELETKFLDFVTIHGMDIANVSKKKKNNDLHEFLEEHIKNQDTNVGTNAHANQELNVEDYDVWKARILAVAKQEMLEV